jgi:uncharacterized membrane protein YgcG
MRYKILLYGLMAAVITSCSSAYKASQTPDDVYYSPAREGVQKQTAQRDRYEDYVASEDDRYVPSYNYNYDYYRNNVFNPYFSYNWYSPYSSFYHPYMNSSFGYYNGYNNIGLYYPQYGYNPYGASYISKNPARVVSSSVSRPNLDGYRNGLYNNANSSTNRSNQGVGNTLKRVFSANENARTYNNENSNTNTYNAPQRTYTPAPSSSSSSSGSSSSGSSGGGGVSRPPR